MEEQGINSMSKICSMVNKKTQILWKNEAYIRFYETRCNEIQKEIEAINEEIENINSDIERTKPEIEQLEYCFNSQTEAIIINHQSLITQELYNNNLVDKSVQLKEKYTQILGEFEEQVKQYEETLKSKDLYKELVEKQIKMKKCEINCLNIQQKCDDLRDIHKKQRVVKRKIFYNDIVKFAKWFVNENRLKQMECNKKDEQLSKMKEKEPEKQLLNVQEEMENKAHKPITKSSQAIEQINIMDMINQVISSEQNSLSNSYKLSSPQKQFNNEMSKVRILDVQTVVASSSKEKSPEKPTLSQRFKKFISQMKVVSQNEPETHHQFVESSESKNLSKNQESCQKLQEQQAVIPKDNICMSQKSSENIVTGEEEKENWASDKLQAITTAVNIENKRTFNFCQEKISQNNIPITCSESRLLNNTNRANFNFFNNNFSSQLPEQNANTNEQFQLPNSYEMDNRHMDMDHAASIDDSNMYMPMNLSPSEDMFSTEGYAAFMKSPEYLMEGQENMQMFQMGSPAIENDPEFGDFSKGFKLF